MEEYRNRITDDMSIKKALEFAKENNLAIGAHIGFQDIAGFGNTKVYLEDECLEALIVYQLSAISAYASMMSLEIEHVRLHGAMYSMLNEDIEYAKKMCAEFGQPDMPIYAGPNRHKLNMEIYPKDEYEMIPIGSTGIGNVYMDCLTGRKRIDDPLHQKQTRQICGQNFCGHKNQEVFAFDIVPCLRLRFSPFLLVKMVDQLFFQRYNIRT